MMASLVHFLKALLFAFWGAIKVLCPSFRRKRPDFSADVCLVTGAGHGLGRELAIKLAECGATLVLWDINAEKVQSVAEEIREMGNNAYSYVCNCADRDEVYSTAEQVREEVGDVAVVINNAGIVSGKKIMESDDRSIERTFEVNTLAPIWVTKAFLPWMLENDYGYVVSIASVMAFGAVPGLVDYSASKAAARIFAEGLRLELQSAGKTGITVTCVCPFHMMTGMFRGITLSPLLPSMKPEEVAERTITAMAEKQFLVITPRLFYLNVFLKSLLPTRANEELLKALGADRSMDTFRGHEKED